MSDHTHAFDGDCPVCQQVLAQYHAARAERYSAPARSLNSVPGRHRRSPESERADRKALAARRRVLARLPFKEDEPT